MDKPERFPGNPVIGGLSRCGKFYLQEVYQLLTENYEETSPHVSRRGRGSNNLEIYLNILFLTRPALRKNGFIRA